MFAVLRILLSRLLYLELSSFLQISKLLSSGFSCNVLSIILCGSYLPHDIACATLYSVNISWWAASNEILGFSLRWGICMIMGDFLECSFLNLDAWKR